MTAEETSCPCKGGSALPTLDNGVGGVREESLVPTYTGADSCAEPSSASDAVEKWGRYPFFSAFSNSPGWIPLVLFLHG